MGNRPETCYQNKSDPVEANELLTPEFIPRRHGRIKYALQHWVPLWADNGKKWSLTVEALHGGRRKRIITYLRREVLFSGLFSHLEKGFIFMNKRSLLLILLSLGFTYGSPATTGQSGMITTPSAWINDDGDLSIGYLRMSDQFSHFRVDETRANRLFPIEGIHAAFSFLPFLELSMVYHLEPFQDRLANAKVRVIKEGKIHPTVVIGFQDVFTFLRGVENTDDKGTAKTSYYGSLYLLTGKEFNWKIGTLPQNVRVQIGYGLSGFDNALYSHLDGFFGGIALTPVSFVPVTILGEYDSDRFYAGVSGTLFQHFDLTLGTRSFEEFSLATAVRFNLLRGNHFSMRRSEVSQ